MAAFDERGATETRFDFARRVAHLLDGPDFPTNQNGCFIQIWCRQHGEGEQLRLNGSHRRRLKQTCSTRSAHHRVHDERRSVSSLETTRDHPDNFAGEQHAGFGRGRTQTLQHGFDLLSHDFRIARLNSTDAVGILRGDAGDGAGAVHAERSECFQIGLNARAAAAVGTGDGESHGHSFCLRHRRFE